jgi:hypothetical protein
MLFPIGIHRSPERPVSIAPLPELVRYLAAFSRALTAIQRWSQTDDRQGMLLGGYVANSLHNVPGHLRYYEPDAYLSFFPCDPGVPQSPWGNEQLPPRLAEDWAHIFSEGDDLAELGLAADLGNLDFAAPRQAVRCLDALYQGCLSMRLMRNNNGGHPIAWNDVDARWTERAERDGRLNGSLAEVLRPVPSAIVRRGDFNERQFRREILKIVPES